MSASVPLEGDIASSFADRLPADQARRAFHAWSVARAARSTEGRPELGDFAPQRLPPECLPWLMIHRENADGEIVYGLVGEELTHLFRGNPKGRPVLAYAAPEERVQRLATIRRAMHAARPVWFTGALLFDNRASVPAGRLGLPAQSGANRVLVLIYFLLDVLPPGRPHPVGSANFDPRDVLWCAEAELAPPGPKPA